MNGTEFIFQTQSLINELRKVIDESTQETWKDDLKELDERFGLQGQLSDLNFG